jgi:hypothetical protein
MLRSIVVAGMLAQACTASRTVHLPLSPSETVQMNEDFAGREVRVRTRALTQAEQDDIELRSRSDRYATRGTLQLQSDSILWTDASGERKSAPLEAIYSLRALSPGSPRAYGALQGLGVGTAIGAGTGIALGIAAGKSDGCGCAAPNSRPALAVIAGTTLGLLGGALGAISGAIYGHHQEVDFAR